MDCERLCWTGTWVRDLSRVQRAHSREESKAEAKKITVQLAHCSGCLEQLQVLFCFGAGKTREGVPHGSKLFNQDLSDQEIDF